MWYHSMIGGERCPIVDTWWQTETGAIMITPLPGAVTDQAGLGDAALPRHRRRGRRRRTASRAEGGGGFLVHHASRGPSMLRGIWGDHERYRADVLEPASARRLLHRRRRASATRTATSGSSAASTT